ncbi:MAG: VOC family protein [Verrucomicrobia subdivision 3 bacterium]|nr:VOC family protein [Limisphaerales bacterium]
MKSELCLPYVRVKDARASLDYYEKCLGFHKVSEHRFAAGLPLVIGIERGGLRFLLTEHAGDGAFGICVYCYIDDDVDEFCQRCRAAGGHITQELEDMPWARDFGVTDPDGNVIRFGNRRE